MRQVLVDFYWQNGYAVVEDFLRSDECEQALREAERLEVLHRDEKGVGFLMNPHRESEIFLRLLRHPEMIKALESLQQSKIHGLQTMLFFKPPGSSGRDFHQDNFYAKADPDAYISAWVALEDADEENGGLIVFPKSHREPILGIAEDQGSKTIDPEKLEYDRGVTCKVPLGYKMKTLPTRAGTAVFIHGHLIHGSEHNRSRTRFRRALLSTYIKQGFPFNPGTHAKRKIIDVYSVE